MIMNAVIGTPNLGGSTKTEAKTRYRRFAKPHPLFKNYGNRPAAIFIGACTNNCDYAALKFDVDRQ